MSDIDKTVGEKVEGRTDQAVGEAKEDLGKTTGDAGRCRQRGNCG